MTDRLICLNMNDLAYVMEEIYIQNSFYEVLNCVGFYAEYGMTIHIYFFNLLFFVR